VSDSTRSNAFLSIARPYVRRTLANELDGVLVHGLESTIAHARARPLVIATTHVSFWDPLLVFALDQALPGEGRALMDAANLARLPFFGRVGAIPLDRSDRQRALADLDSAAAMLDAPEKRVWIFPQGRQRPTHLRPLGLRPGVLRLVAASGAAVVPVALTYAFRECPRPACLVSFGEPIEPSALAEGGLDTLEWALLRELAVIDNAHEARSDDGFVTLVASRVPRPDDSIATKWLARLVR